jgi:hypothetical protein
MASPAFTPLNQTFYKLRLNPDMWDERQAFYKSLQVRGYKPDPGFVFQCNGITYGPIPKGGTITVPEDVCKIAQQASLLYERVLDPETGEKLPQLDKRSIASPMLEVVSKWTVDQTVTVDEPPAAAASQCPYCTKQFSDLDEFRTHLEAHFAGEASKPGTLKVKKTEAVETIHAPIDDRPDEGDPLNVLMRHAPAKE